MSKCKPALSCRRVRHQGARRSHTIALVSNSVTGRRDTFKINTVARAIHPDATDGATTKCAVGGCGDQNAKVHTSTRTRNVSVISQRPRAQDGLRIWNSLCRSTHN